MPKTKRKPKGISPKTKRAIKAYVKQGYSANKIQKKLQTQGLGIQRKRLLAEVRKVKGAKPKALPQKYTPKSIGVEHLHQQEDQSILGNTLQFTGIQQLVDTRN
jgi:hypothetical protein